MCPKMATDHVSSSFRQKKKKKSGDKNQLQINGDWWMWSVQLRSKFYEHYESIGFLSLIRSARDGQSIRWQLYSSVRLAQVARVARAARAAETIDESVDSLFVGSTNGLLFAARWRKCVEIWTRNRRNINKKRIKNLHVRLMGQSRLKRAFYAAWPCLSDIFHLFYFLPASYFRCAGQTNEMLSMSAMRCRGAGDKFFNHVFRTGNFSFDTLQNWLGNFFVARLCIISFVFCFCSLTFGMRCASQWLLLIQIIIIIMENLVMFSFCYFFGRLRF